MTECRKELFVGSWFSRRSRDSPEHKVDNNVDQKSKSLDLLSRFVMIVEQETVDEQKGGPVGGVDVDKEREGTKSMPVFLVGVGVVEGRQYEDQH